MEYKIDSEKPSYQEFDPERQFEERGEREKKKTFNSLNTTLNGILFLFV